MMNTKKSIGKRSNGRRQAISTWNVFIPPDINRRDYILNCFRTSSVSLTNDNAEVVHRVPVGKLAIQMINFPEDYNELGSMVICGYLNYKDTIVVLDILDVDGYSGNEEHQLKITKNTDDGSAEVFLDGENGIAALNSHSRKGKAITSISASDKNKTAEVNIRSNGTVNINSNKGINLKDNTGFDVEIFDGVADQDKTNLKADRKNIDLSVTDGEKTTTIHADKEKIDLVANDKVNLGSGEEPIVLGNTLAKLLKELIQEVAISQTNAGPLLNSAKIAAYIQKVDTILSKYGFTQ